MATLWMFEECRMPDISDLDPLVPTLLLHIFAGEPGLNREQGLVRRNFVRLTDKAVEEYKRARKAWLDQVEEAHRPMDEMMKGRPLHILGFTDHFETCVNALARLVRQLERMGKYFTINRTSRRVIDSLSGDLKSARDGLEHLDEWLQNGELVEGQPIALMIGDRGDAASFGKYELKFKDVELLIRRLHQVSRELLGIDSTVSA
jgi:hypothetical protein